MTNILDKDQITEEDLHSLIRIQAEESINLEFKSAGSLATTEPKKAEIAKDISAFANSAGGIIVYGISEKEHKADVFTPINGDIFTKEWLEQVIQSRIQRKIQGLQIIPIRLSQKVSDSVYVVRIPESALAPHMTSEKKFYKRFNFESVQMEEYEIRNLYNRKEKTKLIIDNIVRTGKPYEEDGVIYHSLGFQIENIGKAVEKDYKLLIQLNFDYYSLKWDPLRHNNNFNHSLIDNNKRIISFSAVAPIFPDEVLTIGYVDFGLPLLRKEQTNDTEVFALKLHYSNGIDELTIPLKEIAPINSYLP